MILNLIPTGMLGSGLPDLEGKALFSGGATKDCPIISEPVTSMLMVALMEGPPATSASYT